MEVYIRKPLAIFRNHGNSRRLRARLRPVYVNIFLCHWWKTPCGREEGGRGGRRKHRRGKWEGGRIVELYPGTNQSSLRRPSHARFYATSFFSRHASLSLNVNAREREIPIHPECTTIPVSPSPWLTDAFNHDSFNHVGSPSSRVFRSEIFYPLTRACFP